MAAKYEAQNWTVPLDGTEVPLSRFLSDCVRAVDAGDEPLTDQQRRFLTAGLAAVRTVPEDQRWVQVGLAVPEGRAMGLYADLDEFAHELFAGGLLANMFFMRKPPGLRLRYQARPDRLTELAEAVRRRGQGWRDRGLVSAVLPSVYEPEAHLFGGVESMRYAHELFTADSVAWLALYRRVDRPPVWAVSLLMLRALFDGLEIVGWEDRDVWDRVRGEAGRRLPAAGHDVDGTEAAVDRLRNWWSDPDRLAKALPEWAGQVVDRHRQDALDVGRQWRAGYFDTAAAYLGPRQVAAYYIVFHWNRAGLTPVRQMLLAEALARPPEASGTFGPTLNRQRTGGTERISTNGISAGPDNATSAGPHPPQ